jgi:hypothetical protein
MGRRPKLTELQRRVARQRIAKGESARSIAQQWGVALWLTLETNVSVLRRQRHTTKRQEVAA